MFALIVQLWDLAGLGGNWGRGGQFVRAALRGGPLVVGAHPHRLGLLPLALVRPAHHWVTGLNGNVFCVLPPGLA